MSKLCMLSITDVGRVFFKCPNSGQIVNTKHLSQQIPFGLETPWESTQTFWNESRPNKLLEWIFSGGVLWIHRGVWYSWDVYLKEMEMVNVDVVCWVLGSSTNFSWYPGNPRHETAMIFSPFASSEFFFLSTSFYCMHPKILKTHKHFPSSF